MRLQLLIVFIITIVLSATSVSSSLIEPKKTIEQKQCDDNHPALVNYFSWVDYTVLGIMLLVSCLIGTFYGFFSSKQETSVDFLLGGSHMGTIPMAMSLAASFITAIELLGNPAEMYGQVNNLSIILLFFFLLYENYNYVPNTFLYKFLGDSILDDLSCFYLCRANNVKILFTSLHEITINI